MTEVLSPFDPLIDLTSEIVSAYVKNNALRVEDVAQLITEVHASLKTLSTDVLDKAPIELPLMPAVSIKKSLTPDHIVCLDCGKTFKSIKRHVGSHGMTPDEYRAKWKLPESYPMVAPAYSAVRSALAKSNGLGKKIDGVVAPKIGRPKKAA